MAPSILVLSTVHTPLDARIHFRQITSLLDAGWQVTQAAPWSGYRISPPARGPNYRTLEVRRAAGKRRTAALLDARQLLRRQRHNHDVVLLHDPELLAAAGGQLGKLPPVIYDVHEDTAAAVRTDRAWIPPAARTAAAAALTQVERWAERRLHLLLAEDGYQQRFTTPHTVVHNYPPVPPHPPDPASRPHTAAYLGRIGCSRGAEEMISLSRKLADAGIRFDLYGPADKGTVETRLRAADAAGHLTWHGFTPNNAALDQIRTAAAGLALFADQPNHRVSLPTKVLEYPAHGIPVITTPIPAAAETVTRHHLGAVVPFGDAEAATDAIATLVKHDTLAARRARWQTVSAHYSWQTEQHRFLAAVTAAAR